MQRAMEAVRELRQGDNSAQALEVNRIRDFLEE
jgi:hypothetical protein